MKLRLLYFIIILTALLAACSEDNSTTAFNRDQRWMIGRASGDIVSVFAVIRLDDNYNNCSEGFDNYRLYEIDGGGPLCAVVDSSDFSTQCLPDYFKVDGLHVKVTYVGVPIPPNVRMNCRPVKLLSIESVGRPRRER